MPARRLPPYRKTASGQFHPGRDTPGGAVAGRRTLRGAKEKGVPLRAAHFNSRICADGL
jgi:hypothetical protein